MAAHALCEKAGPEQKMFGFVLVKKQLQKMNISITNRAMLEVFFR